MITGTPGLRMWLRMQKYLIWAVLIFILYLVRHLFAVIFLTFVLAYICNTATNFLARHIHYRRLALVIVYVSLLIFITAIALAALPRIYKESKELVVQYLTVQKTDTTAVVAPVDDDSDRRRRARDQVEPPPVVEDTAALAEPAANREIRKIIADGGGRLLGGEFITLLRESIFFEQLVEGGTNFANDLMPKILEGLKEALNGVFAFFIAMIFSFLIIWDLPRIRKNVRSYSRGPTSAIYAEVAPGLHAFGLMLGRAFEAQTGIAFVNTLFSSIGFTLLGLPSIALLAMIVFFCSYIPVLGVFLSTVPAALLALKVGGFGTVMGVVVMVCLVHAIEAYGLNPLIYGHHLRLHPVGVLLVLLIGEHLFAVWGLILAVPVTAFCLKYVIKGEAIDAEEKDETNDEN